MARSSSLMSPPPPHQTHWTSQVPWMMLPRYRTHKPQIPKLLQQSPPTFANFFMSLLRGIGVGTHVKNLWRFCQPDYHVSVVRRNPKVLRRVPRILIKRSVCRMQTYFIFLSRSSLLTDIRLITSNSLLRSTPFQAKRLLAYLSTRLQQLLYEALEKERN
jgi:hypothetical protein